MPEKFPSEKECMDILRKYKTPENVIRHLIKVKELAVRIGEMCRGDTELIAAGALLHDLGRSRSHGLDHAVLGADIARDEGLPEAVIRIIERHIGAGINKEEAKRLGLPERDYIPETLEEKIVAHADNLVYNDRVPVEFMEDRLRKRGLDEAAERVLSLHRELSEMCGMDLEKV